MQMQCPGCAGDITYQKGEWRVKCPYCGEWRETGEPKPAVQQIPKPPQTTPLTTSTGLTETVEHYLERLRRWRIKCAQVILLTSLIFFAGAALYMKTDVEIAMPVVLVGVAMYFLAPKYFAAGRPKPFGPPASDEIKVPKENITDLKFILLDILIGIATFIIATKIFGPFVWK